MEHADDLAHHTGEGNAYWMRFGPTNVGQWRVAGALEVRDYEQAAAIAESLNPDVLPNLPRRAVYWADYGASCPAHWPGSGGRHDHAVIALRQAEKMSPHHVLRNPFVPDVLAELLPHRLRRDAVGVELRGMAYRAGLPV